MALRITILFLLLFACCAGAATFDQWFTTNTVSQIASPGEGWFLGWSNAQPVWSLNGILFTNLNLSGATNNGTVISNGLYSLIDKRVLTNDTRVLTFAGPVYDTNIGASKVVRTDANNALAPVTIGSHLTFDGTTLDASGGSGTVTSVGISGPPEITWANSPITTSGTLSGTTAGFIVTNGESQATTISNQLTVDAQHALVANNSSASSLASFDSGHNLTNASVDASLSFSVNKLALPSVGTAGTYADVVTDTFGRATNGVYKPGYNWIQQTLTLPPAGGNWKGVAFGNSMFVAVSGSGSTPQTNDFPYSYDGITWHAVGTAPQGSKAWNGITYGNGLFVAVGSGDNATSTDGTNWTTRTAAEANTWNSVCYGKGLFVAVASAGTHRVQTSPDGITWTAQTQSTNGTFNSVTWGNDLYVAIGTSGTLMTSIDGVNWFTQTNAENNSWQSITYGKGLFVAVGNGTHKVETSADGTNWFSQTAASGPSAYNCVAYGNGVFASAALNGAQVSTDGTNWTAITAANLSWQGMVFGDGMFVSVANTAVSSSAAMISGNRILNYSPPNNIQQGTLTVNGGFTNNNATASRMAFHDSGKQIISASASGAVPIDADGTATTFAQVQALAPDGLIVTNGESQVITISNNWVVDPTHFLTGNVAALTVTNFASAGSRMQLTDANKKVSDAAASGAVPIDADGSATTFGQVNALASAFILTNNTTSAMVLSNTFKLDAQHALSLSNLTTGHVLQVGADSTISSVSSGAVPINGDGTATTAAQLLAIAGSKTLWSANTGNLLIPASTTIFFPLNNCTSNLLVYTSDASGGTRSLCAVQTTFKNMRVISSANPGTSKCTITLMTNGVASNLACGPSGGTTASDTTDTVLCAAGVEAGWKMVIGSSATSAKYEIAVESDQ